MLGYYCQTRSQIFKVETWEYEAVFDNVIKSRFAGDAKKALDRLRQSFHDARLQEDTEGKRYLGKLRDLMWQSMDLIFTQFRKTTQFSFLTGQKSCLIMLDNDHFKKINDS